MRIPSRASKLGALLLPCLAVLPLTTGCDRVKERLKTQLRIRPKQEQPAKRLAEIAALDVQREGRLLIQAIPVDGKTASGQSTRIKYSLVAPAATVEDTDIRGYLDGSTKYSFNQGTAYHMRVGRRYGGPHAGRYELKRSLVRWRLPGLPPNARFVSAQAIFWVEAFPSGSPLRQADPLRPLHLYLYPVAEEWAAGFGGIRQNDFSEASPGEAWWNEARSGELAWPAAGALEPEGEQPRRHYRVAPVGFGPIVASGTALAIGGAKLVNYLQEVNQRNEALSLLLKLGDEEEDRVGTELALFSSNFGDVNDVLSKRPRLEFEIEIPYAADSREDHFVLEAGTEYVSEVLEHLGRKVVLTVAIDPMEGIPPQVYVRGGHESEPGRDVEWEVYSYPILRDWDWSQFRIASPRLWLSWGDSLRLDIHETWVRPGPRVKQLPELVLIAPSGRVHRLHGRSTSDRHYVMEFLPDEFGLWRYGWSFLPMRTREQGSHQGEGVFYVGIAEGEDEAEKLEELAAELSESVRRGGYVDESLQIRMNGFVRWAVRYGRRGPEEKRTSDRLLAAVLEAFSTAPK